MQPITRKQYDAVYALLHRGRLHERLKQTEIASRTGVSERTIRKISTGKIQRPADEPEPTQPRMHDGIEFKIVDEYRCKCCGMKVTLQPCLYCHEQAKKRPKY